MSAVVELFAGVSGLGLGLETQGWETVAFSDFDPKLNRQYAAEVMQLRHPRAAALGDIRTLTFARNQEGVPGIMRFDEAGNRELLYKGPVRIIAGGFPCQNVSTAGKGGGVREGDRSGLWRDFARAIEGLQPDGVLIENVAALTGRGLDIVLMDLHRLGYDAEWDVISAAGVGAPHLRERIFIIAWKAGTAAHAPWPAPPLFDTWFTEPEGVPRLVTDDVDQRVARLRCLGNAVVPQCAAHVAAILAERLDQSWRIDGGRFEHDHSADDLHTRGPRKGDLKWWGTAFPADAVEATPGYVGWIDLVKLPRAGRMTGGLVVQRVRTCEQRFAKKRALSNMAATLRPRATDHPELPHEGLVPTPSASLPNDGERAETWIDRKVEHAEKGDAATRASMPLAIYAQVKDGQLLSTPRASENENRQTKPSPSQAAGMRGRNLASDVALLPTPKATDGDKGVRSVEGAAAEMARGRGGDLDAAVKASLVPTPTVADATGGPGGGAAMQGGGSLRTYVVGEGAPDRLVPTPTAKDADSTRSRTAIRTTPPARVSQPGETLTDFVDPTNGGQLLPTPRTCAGIRSSGLNRTEMMDALELTEGALVPTPTVQDASNNGGPSQGNRNSLPLNKLVNGRLNPAWVEWLMGFPPGWTDLAVGDL